MKKFLQILFSTLSIYVLVIFSGAYLTLKVEQEGKNTNIKNYYDSLWWSLNATSIGDSNVYPITIKGRIIGTFLIVIGYGLFTINVGTISAGLIHFTKTNNVEEKIEKLLKRRMKNE